MTLLAMQTFLAREVDRLRDAHADPEEIARRAAELEMVDDELRAAMSDPRIATLLAGWG